MPESDDSTCTSIEHPPHSSGPLSVLQHIWYNLIECALVCSDTAWSIPCCAAVSASISVEGPLSAVGAPLCELGDDGTEGGAEESGAVCTKVEKTTFDTKADPYQLNCWTLLTNDRD